MLKHLNSYDHSRSTAANGSPGTSGWKPGGRCSFLDTSPKIAKKMQLRRPLSAADKEIRMKLKTIVKIIGLFLIVAHAGAALASDGAIDAPTDFDFRGHASANTPMPSGQFSHPYAPLGVPGSHVIKPGKWMFAYTYGHMAMDGNLSGTDEVSTAEILQRFPVAPVSMDVDMHMVCAMRGITENFTAMVMLPYFFKSMTMVNRNGVRFSTHTDGVGDLQIAGIFSLYRTKMHQLVFTGGLSAPTGSIDVRDNTPMAPNTKLGYTMQLGSGTVDLLPALTYMGKCDRVHWGTQVSGTVRLDENANDYRLGNRYRITGWGGYQLFDGVIGSLRLDWQSWGNIHGADPEMDPTTTPGKNPDLRGGDRLDILSGLAWYIDEGPLKGNRLFVEGGVPIYQSLDGPQGKTTWMLMAGWRFVF